jgi:hypothetical protein
LIIISLSIDPVILIWCLFTISFRLGESLGRHIFNVARTSSLIYMYVVTGRAGTPRYLDIAVGILSECLASSHVG